MENGISHAKGCSCLHPNATTINVRCQAEIIAAVPTLKPISLTPAAVPENTLFLYILAPLPICVTFTAAQFWKRTGVSAPAAPLYTEAFKVPDSTLMKLQFLKSMYSIFPVPPVKNASVVACASITNTLSWNSALEGPAVPAKLTSGVG